MRLVAFILVAFVVGFIGLSQLLKPVRITLDQGGILQQYVQDAMIMSLTKRRLEIDGPCVSACLMFFHKDYNIPICVTQRAILGFHYPYPFDKDTIITKKVDSMMKTIGDHMLSGLPSPVQATLLKQHLPRPTAGDPVNDLALVRYDTLKQVYPDCESS